MTVQVEHDLAGAAPVPCWSCKGPVAPIALFCSTCGAVQPPGAIDHFRRLAMPAGFDLDQAELDRHYFGFQRRLHPDRFATRSPRERALSQAQATALNEAYETLKDPLRRAAYMLRLAGHPLDLDGAATIADAALLTWVMERREAIEEAADSRALDALIKLAAAEREDAVAGLSRAFASGDVEEASRLAVRFKYLLRMAEEARARHGRLTGA